MVSLCHLYDSQNITLAIYLILSNIIFSVLTSGNMLPKLTLLVFPQRTSLDSGMLKTIPKNIPATWRENSVVSFCISQEYIFSDYQKATKFVCTLPQIIADQKTFNYFVKINWIKSKDGCYVSTMIIKVSKILKFFLYWLLWLFFGFPSEFSNINKCKVSDHRRSGYFSKTLCWYITIK